MFVQNTSSREQLTADKGGDSGSTSLPAIAAPSLREQFDAISVRVIINGQPFDVAVPVETYGKPYHQQEAIAKEIGGHMANRAENEAVVNYLLDRKACYLLAQEKAGKITEREASYLSSYREKWEQDKEGERRAENAGTITDKETELLNAYRGISVNWVHDTQGGIDLVLRPTVASTYNFRYPFSGAHFGGALVVCSSAESK